MCSSGSALIDGKYAIHPTYVIPVSAVTSPPPEDIQYDLQQEDITPMESSPFSKLFHLLRSLYHFEDENSVVAPFLYPFRISYLQNGLSNRDRPGRLVFRAMNGRRSLPA